jgi:hypothetical protein
MTQPVDVIAAMFGPGMFQGWELLGQDCKVTIYPRPAYCNRGNYHALFDGPRAVISENDSWPRYYFDLDRAKRELEALLDKRQLRIPGAPWRRFDLDPEGRHINLQEER